MNKKPCFLIPFIVIMAKADAEKNVEATLAFIDTLHQHGTDFLFVFCTSKPAVYPEYMPKAYRDQISDFQLEEYYIQLFKDFDSIGSFHWRTLCHRLQSLHLFPILSHEKEQPPL